MQKQRATYRPEDRLRSKAEYELVLHQKCSVRGKCLIVYGMKNTLDRPRLGRVIGKRWGNAVARNRYRRWVREAFRINKSELPSLDLVVMLAHNKELTYRKIVEDFVRLAEQLRTRLSNR